MPPSPPPPHRQYHRSGDPEEDGKRIEPPGLGNAPVQQCMRRAQAATPRALPPGDRMEAARRIQGRPSRIEMPQHPETSDEPEDQQNPDHAPPCRPVQPRRAGRCLHEPTVRHRFVTEPPLSADRDKSKPPTGSPATRTSKTTRSSRPGSGRPGPNRVTPRWPGPPARDTAPLPPAPLPRR